MEALRLIRPVLRLPLRPAPSLSPSSTSSLVSQTSTLLQKPLTRLTSQSTRLSAPAAPSEQASSIASLLSGLRQPTPNSPTSSSTVPGSKDKNAPLHSHPQQRQPWHLHIYSHKHNTHLTLTRPNRKAVISISAGNIGFRKHNRGTYDAAFQLGAYMMARVNRAGLLDEIGGEGVEVVFRGFGQGREAMTKILLGTEGSAMREKVRKVSDATRLKFGGTRSPRPRRL